MKRVFNLFDDRNYDIIALQETHWKDKFIEDYKHVWNGQIYYNNVDTSSKGVAFLIRNNIKSSIEYVNSFDGRFLHITYKENDVIYDIINIYAPNSVKEKVLFFKKVSDQLPSSTRLILLGDFNNTLAEIDRCGKTLHTFDQSFKAIVEMMSKHNVIDIWRKRNDRTKTFSRKIIREGVLVQSRIDYILVSRTIDVYVRNIFYVETTMSDHSMVTLYFNTDVHEKGPGTWIHNNLLLCEDSYRKKIIELIDKEKECNLYNTYLNLVG